MTVADDDNGITLVLGGMGVKGIANIGALQALREHKVRIKKIVATGISSLVAAQFGLGRDLGSLTNPLVHFFAKHQNKLWGLELLSGSLQNEGQRAIETFTRFFRSRFLCKAMITRLNLISWEPIQLLLDQLFGDASSSQLRVPLAISALDLKRGREVLLERADLIERLKAGMAIPGICPPVCVGNREFVSSILYCELPLGRLRETDHPIAAIDVASSSTIQRPKSIIDILARADELRSMAIKRMLLAKAERIFYLEGLGRFPWRSYDQIPQLISQAHQDMDNLLHSAES